jgi:hypothetical protein
MDGYWITLKNGLDCDLDRRFAATPEAAATAASAMIAETGSLEDGDQIVVASGWSEED